MKAKQSKPILIVDAIYNHRPIRIYDKYAPSLRAERGGY
jgi:hypothetical protein